LKIPYHFNVRLIERGLGHCQLQLPLVEATSCSASASSTFDSIRFPHSLIAHTARMSTKKAIKSIQTKLARGDTEDALSEATSLLKELNDTSPEMSQVYVQASRFRQESEADL
jgi:hypothetical protein